ncbi:hypothetical protein FKM82_014225 [Ascaphus truei]
MVRRMGSLFNCLPSFCLILVVIFNHLGWGSTLEPSVKAQRILENNKYEQDRWLHQLQERHHRKPGMARKDRTRGRPSPALIPAEEAKGPPLRGEAAEVGQPSALKQDRDEFQSFDFPYNQREKQTLGIHSKGKKHNRENKRSSQKDRVKPHRGRGFEAESSALLKEDASFKEPTQFTRPEMSPSVSATMLPLSTSNPMFIHEHPTVVLETPRRVRAHMKKGGDVMPTLDMTLFDWTDYEDMKPDTWPSPKKKGKQREKMNNITSLVEEEPCDHHLDCLPG